MLKFLRALLSPDIRQAKRLLRNHTRTVDEALESAEKILALPAYDRHRQLRLMRAACLIKGMARLHEVKTLKCRPTDLSCLKEPELVDFAAEALRSAAEKAQDESHRQKILDAIPRLPGIVKFKVVGELYDSRFAYTAQESKEEVRMTIYATSLQAALPPAYRRYKKILVADGYRVDGKNVNNGSFTLCLFSSYA